MPAARKLILRNFQSPGDTLMLTAAVRDLHRSYPGQFVTDVRTPSPPIWHNNPYLSPLPDGEATPLDCQYPLIHSSNALPRHFIEGFIHDLNDKLGLTIKLSAFRGDIHLSAVEKGWMSQVQEQTAVRIPFWIVVAGGKRDFTIKWWDAARFQAVVDAFQQRILFVQVGSKEHYHPQLKNVIDLRGKTDLRQLIRLVHHSDGILCPVTLMMHLAAAVESPAGRPSVRPCVVVAGGREPPQWEAYPHHQYIHTVGALKCCAAGGCWKSRTIPLGDGSEHDKQDKLCVDVVSSQPRCMHLITADQVISRIESYFAGGMLRYLTPAEAAIIRARRILTQ